MKQAKRIILLGLAVVIGLVVLICLSLPLWLPWVLRPAASRFGLQYADYQREGYGRFALRQVAYRTGDMEFKADHVEGLLPYAWLLRRYQRDQKEPFLQVDGWLLQWGSQTAANVSGPGSPRAAQAAEIDSIPAAVREVRSSLAALENWLPRAELRNGSVRLPGGQIDLPVVHWASGRLSAEAAAPAYQQTAKVQADLPATGAWQLSSQVRPAQVDLNLSFKGEGPSVRMEGAVLWRTNRLSLLAEFNQQGWLPQLASATAEQFRIPALLLGLPGYDALAGSFAGRWTNGQFRLDLSAQAQPLATNTSEAFPVQVVLRAVGDTNLVRIEHATAQAPWINAEFSPGAVLDFKGHLLSDQAALHIHADLAGQRWVRANGLVNADAVLRRSGGRVPDVSLSISGKAIESAGITAEELQVNGSLVWPWLDISRAEARFAEGASAVLLARANLQTRTISNGVLHLEGKLGANLLQPKADYRQGLIHVNFHGPVQSLSHAGVLQVDGLTFGNVPALEVRADWSGRSSDLDHFAASAATGKAALLLRGSANAEGGKAGLRVTELTLTNADQELYVLEQPFSVSLERDQGNANSPSRQWSVAVTPFRWVGSERSLSLQGDVAWPVRGAFRVAAEHLDTSVLSSFISLPSIRIDHVNVAGQWTNGPMHFTADVATEIPVQGHLPLNARVNATGDQRGLVVEHLEVTSDGATVLSGHGSAPMKIEPSHPERILQMDFAQPIELHATTAPNRFFWDQISTWTRVGLADPRVQLDISGSLTNPVGTITASIAAIHPERLWTNRQLPRLEDVHVQVDLSRATFRVPDLKLLVEGQRINLNGEVPLGTNYSTDWRRFLQWQQATGAVQVVHAQIAPFARFLPKALSPQGFVNLDLALRPDWQWNGQIAISGAATRPLASLGSIDDLETRLKLEGRRIDVQTFTGLLGGEPFGVTGSIDLSHRNPNTGVPRLALRVRGQSLPLARQPDLILRSDLDLAISTGTNDQQRVSGSVRLRDSVFLSDLRVLVPGRVAKPRERPPYFSIDLEPLADWILDLHVRGDKFLKVRSPFFRGEISTDMRLEGTLKEPMILGEVTVNSGVVQFPFANLNLTQGLVSFTSADPYRPELFVTAGARTLGYDVKMEVSGKVDSPVIQFTSTPPLSSEQVLLMVTAGELPQQASSTSTQQRASRLALFLGRNLLSEFGSGQGGADRLTLRSGKYISEQGKQTYSLEYRLNKDWSIVGEYDRFGAFNAELKWRLYSR